VYASCLFCNRALGANEIIDRFPVGRRLAFDPAKGRLWVVCPHCRQWNLTPLEERWEAIEDCERRFRDARRRVSTGEIGLARLPEGVELIRIGQPLLPELAAWRFGPRLRLRRMQALAVAGTLAPAGRWKLGVCHDDGMRVYHDDDALAPARHLLAGINAFGGTKRQLDGAVDLLAGVRSANEYFGMVATSQRSKLAFGIGELPVTVRLALELASHEETERRAMEGELADLAQAWRQAEEIAAIADNMFLPATVDAFFRRFA
jgi:hypothetical protein